MTNRDKTEVGSKFWNEGKWENYVKPFLPEDCSDLTFVDMGCNAGVFLNQAEDLGFHRVVGVDSNKGAIERGKKWRDEHGKKYRMMHAKMEKCLDDLPLADYTVLANAHYYFTINDWLDYLDKLQYKTRHCIIVTAEKKHGNRCWASPDLDKIRYYFKGWEEVGFIDALPLKGDPHPRKLWGFCFKSPHLHRVPIEPLDSGNHVQDSFWGEIDSGKDYKDTRYYRILTKYRKKWGKEKLDRWIEERIAIYEDMKKYGLKKPVIVNFRDKLSILDGNHRHSGRKSLGYKTEIVRYA